MLTIPCCFSLSDFLTIILLGFLCFGTRDVRISSSLSLIFYRARSTWLLLGAFGCFSSRDRRNYSANITILRVSFGATLWERLLLWQVARIMGGMRLCVHRVGKRNLGRFMIV